MAFFRKKGGEVKQVPLVSESKISMPEKEGKDYEWFDTPLSTSTVVRWQFGSSSFEVFDIDDKASTTHKLESTVSISKIEPLKANRLMIMMTDSSGGGHGKRGAMVCSLKETNAAGAKGFDADFKVIVDDLNVTDRAVVLPEGHLIMLRTVYDGEKRCERYYLKDVDSSGRSRHTGFIEFLDGEDSFSIKMHASDNKVFIMLHDYLDKRRISPQCLVYEVRPGAEPGASSFSTAGINAYINDPKYIAQIDIRGIWTMGGNDFIAVRRVDGNSEFCDLAIFRIQDKRPVLIAHFPELLNCSRIFPSSTDIVAECGEKQKYLLNLLNLVLSPLNLALQGWMVAPPDGGLFVQNQNALARVSVVHPVLPLLREALPAFRGTPPLVNIVADYVGADVGVYSPSKQLPAKIAEKALALYSQIQRSIVKKDTPQKRRLLELFRILNDCLESKKLESSSIRDLVGAIVQDSKDISSRWIVGKYPRAVRQLFLDVIEANPQRQVVVDLKSSAEEIDSKREGQQRPRV